MLLILTRREFPAFLPALRAPLRAGFAAEAGARARGRVVAALGGCLRGGGAAAVPSGRRWPAAEPLQSGSARLGDGAGSRPAESELGPSTTQRRAVNGVCRRPPCPCSCAGRLGLLFPPCGDRYFSL